jgi:DNA-binding NtrC family response regulator
MVKTRAGDGAAVASAALSSFRGADIVATYAHDEIEFLLPDTPSTIAHAVVDRLLETAEAGGAAVGMAIAPEDGDDAERLIRAARDALAKSMRESTAISRPETEAPEPTESTIRTDVTRLAVSDIQAAAMRDEPVLLVGEANSGKRHYARMLHERSRFSAGPMMLIQCAALLDADAVAEAFGQDDGGDCTATKAHGGTLVLEEIGDLPLQAQRRLLKLLEREGRSMGLVSTTHRDLGALCQVGAFLEPLYARLAVVKVGVPALRMRAESIVPLAKNFAAEYNHSSVKLSPGAIEKMRLYAWPGNVLELRNAMERAVTLADGGEILAEHLPGDPTDTATGEGRLRQHVGSVERDVIIKALADNNYNQTHAASELGISRRALIYKMEKYGLKPPPAGHKRD